MVQSMSSLKFGEQEAGEELMSAALYVEEGQEEDEGAPQDGMAYLRWPIVSANYLYIEYYASYLNLLHHRAVRAERKQCPDTVTASVLPPPPRKLLKKDGSGAEGEPPLRK